MAQNLYLIKYGELQLKGENRGQFERRLCEHVCCGVPECGFAVWRIKGADL